ncbi:MAG: RnfABCDGE type electron transport complex subunit D, partial [Cyanobacteria bacterium Co-bin13]|nr:RnfABCDGE type electron transport complex subunit D [Cyanobacteria bacterium Co-bin13]
MLRDARDYQILFLSLFLLLGLATRDWTLRPAGVGCAIAACLLTQWLLTKVVSWRQSAAATRLPLDITSAVAEPLPVSFNWRSPLITALGLSLLLRVDHLPTMALAGFFAIASKFVLRVGDKHFFNPANFGIIAVLLLTHDAWVSPGQWGEEAWYALIFLGAGGLVLKRVGRWDTTVAFLSTYAALEALRNLWLGWSWDVWAHRLMSGSLLLFALFMVTDPRAIPNARPARLIWAAAIALVTFGLRNYLFLPTAVFWALFALSPLTLLLDYLWAAPRFTWKRLPLKPLGTSLGVMGGVAIALFTLAPAAWAFCGFYVAKADTNLYNQASQVIIAR